MKSWLQESNPRKKMIITEPEILGFQIKKWEGKQEVIFQN